MNHINQAVEDAGRINAHEFILEVIIANMFSDLPKEHASQFAGDLIAKSYAGYLTKGPVDADDLQAVSEATGRAAENLVTKALVRSEQIRSVKRAL